MINEDWLALLVVLIGLLLSAFFSGVGALAVAGRR
jgi:hypothetical protein